MTTLLEASRMALEALECYPVTVNHWKIKLLPAATALRTAISEAEKPFGHVTIRRLSRRNIDHVDQYEFYPVGQPPYLDNVDECHTVYLAPQPAPKQEPVATATRSSKHGGIEWSGSEALADALGRFGSDRLVHLYLAPVPAQEPITPQALIEAANSLPGLVSGTSNWASAMAAKLNAAVVKECLTTQEPTPLETQLVDTLLGQAQERKPLDENIIEGLWFERVGIPTAGKRIVAFARAVEAAHGIGEQP